MRLHEVLAPDSVPYEKTETIRKLIRKGAMNPEFNWANALDLVHRAYHSVKIERPLPAMKYAWDQYQDLISFAVDQLQQATDKNVRDDSWRMTSAATKFRKW